MEVGHLLGFQKEKTDLSVRNVRIRYQESVNVPAGRTFRLAYPKIDDELLDLRTASLMRFNLNMINSTVVDAELAGQDAYGIVDSRDVRSLFRRLIVRSGSQVLCDIDDVGSYLLLESQINTSAHTSSYDRYLMGNESDVIRKNYPVQREYIVKFSPIDTLLNCNGCLPLARMNNLSIELQLDTASNCLRGTSNTLSYSLSDIELLTQYIRSPSLSSFYNSNPLSMHVTNLSMRYQTINEQKALVRMSSSHSSLDSIVTILREQVRLNGTIANSYFFRKIRF